MPRLDDVGDDLVQALATHYGQPPPESASWPDSPVELTTFERLARVALGLVATPKVASAAFETLRQHGMLEPENLATANPLEVDDLLKQARVAMAIKSLRPLQKLARWAVDLGRPLDGELAANLPTESTREEWRAINGVGLASADALLLAGLGRATYPVDRATYRILVRHGWLDSAAEYDEARGMVERFAWAQPVSLGRDHGDDHVPGESDIASLLVGLSFWFERVGRDFCKVSQARCEHCPLRTWLPMNGPVEVE